MNPSLRKEIFFLSSLFLLSLFLFGFKLGAYGLLDPDEPFYSLTAREMLQRGDILTPFLFDQPQFEKPIFFYWVLCAAFKLFGESEFAARVGPCVAGFMTVLVTYFWARVLFRKSGVAFLSALILATSAQFVVLSRLVMTDMFLCLFVTSALFCFSWGYAAPERRKTAWAALFLFLGLGFATKGPLGVLLPSFGIFSFLAVSGKKELLREVPWGWGALVFALTGLPWYVLMTAQHGMDFLKDFFIHENFRRFFLAEHRSMDRLYFYPGGMLLGFFPWSVFLIGAFLYAFKRAIKQKRKSTEAFLFLALSFSLPFTFFVAAKSKLLTYTFPLFPVASIMAGVWAYRLRRALGAGVKPSRLLSVLAVLCWGVFPVALASTAFTYNAKQGLALFAPISVITAFLVPLCWFALAAFLKRNLKFSFAALTVMAVTVLALSFGWLLPKAEGAFSSRTTVSHSGLVLTSRMYARGVSYYMRHGNVGVFIEDPRKVFYTPHPVPVLSSLGDLLRLENRAFPVFGVLRPKELGYLMKILDNRFSLSVIQGNGQRAFVRLDRLI